MGFQDHAYDFRMIEPSEDSKGWVALIMSEVAKCDPAKQTDDIAKKQLPLTQLATVLKHRCSGRWIPRWHKLHPHIHMKTTSKALLKVCFRCSECFIKETTCILQNGTIIVGEHLMNPEEDQGMVPNGITEKQVKNGSKPGGQYEERIDPTDVTKFEHPAKFTSLSEKEKFKQRFPGADLTMILEKSKGRQRCLYNPVNTEFLKPILPIVKKIAGCEANLIYHKATEKSFAKLEEHEKIVTFKLKCRLE